MSTSEMTPASAAFASLTNFLENQANPERKAAAKAANEAVASAKRSAAEKTRAVKKPRSNDKKDAAQKLFEANKDKGNGAIATLISKELDITYANSYYYVTRVFKR
jgi:hypothetical protein